MTQTELVLHFSKTIIKLGSVNNLTYICSQQTKKKIIMAAEIIGEVLIEL
jgi:hypothetical protein